MPWWIVAGLVANVAINFVEWANRHLGDGNLLSVLPYTIVPIAIAQVALFIGFRDAPHWLMAWVVFTLGNSAVRLIAVKLTGQPIESWTYVLIGASVMLIGGFILKEGL